MAVDLASLQAEIVQLRAEVARLEAQVQPLVESERRAAHRLQPRLSQPAPAFDLIVERTFHTEGCFNFVVSALQRAFPSVQWQSLVET